MLALSSSNDYFCPGHCNIPTLWQSLTLFPFLLLHLNNLSKPNAWPATQIEVATLTKNCWGFCQEAQRKPHYVQILNLDVKVVMFFFCFVSFLLQLSFSSKQSYEWKTFPSAAFLNTRALVQLLLLLSSAGERREAKCEMSKAQEIACYKKMMPYTWER